MGATKLAMLDEFSQCLGFELLWHRTSAPFISLKLVAGDQQTALEKPGGMASN